MALTIKLIIFSEF